MEPVKNNIRRETIIIDGAKQFTLETGIPLPANGRGTFKNTYPWHKLGIGDSIFVAESDDRTIRQIQSSLTGSWARFNKTREGAYKKFTSRSVIDNGIRGCRAWRVK